MKGCATMTRRTPYAAVCVVFASILASRAQTAPPGSQDSGAVKIDYQQQVRPILANRCFGCHGPRQQQSGLRLDLRQSALRGGDYGAVIVPGNAAGSKLIQRLLGSDAGLQMPLTGALPPDEIAILRAWIDSGADMPGRAAETVVVERPTEPRVQTFIDAIAAHDLKAVQQALATDRTLARAADGSGSTALMHAAYAGTVAIMETLLDAGADVKSINRRGATALHWAIADPAKIKLLLLKGVPVDAKTVDGRTALYAASSLPTGAPVVRLLLEVGAETDARTITETTPLFAAVTASAESVQLLLDKGADPNAVSKTGATPLMAVRSTDVVKLLVSRGASVTARSKRGETALADAAARGDIAAVRLLLDQGADVNAVDYRGYTPLMHATQYDRDSPELVRLLLSRGANVNVKGEGQTPLSIAARRGETELTRLLREALAARTSGSQQ